MEPSNVPYPYPPTSSSSSSRSTAATPSVVPVGLVPLRNGETRPGVGSPFEHKLPDVGDNEPSEGDNDVAVGHRRRLTGGMTSGVTATDVILPTTAASKGVGEHGS